MGKVFISYSHKDEDWVKNYLLVNLERKGIQCHIDFRDFEIGKPSIFNMEHAVETCEKTILVYTPNWVESEWGQFEGVLLQTESPLNLKKKILPLMIEKYDLPKRLSIFTYADFTDKNKWDFQLERLINQIKRDFAAQEPEKIKYPLLDDKDIDTTRLPETGFELFGRQKELKLLSEAWEYNRINVLSFVAYGGVGKSTLVNKWLEKMRWDNYRGAEKVFAWSFYSQGTSEYVTSADMFINYTLKWFGDKNPEKGSAWDKGKRLARFICQYKTLLILDGLEPLQSCLGIEKGEIKDPALTMLITDLAKYNKGLCIITTRERIPELDLYTKTSKQENLEYISDEAGKKLLQLRGAEGKENKLVKVVNEFGNHALAINLLAEYLHQFPGHSVNKASEIPDIDIPEEKGKYPCRIIEAFAEQFGTNSPEFELLSILGLFDRPVEKKAINSIISGTPIPGLTLHLSKIKEAAWHHLLDNLRKYKLTARKSEHRPTTIDCHPLVREHFGEKLKSENPKAWKEAHSRLYEYYKNLPEKLYGKYLPDTLEEVEPLFAAVMHGCLAGRHQEAHNVYWKRIHRKNKHYIYHKLGAFGADLACLSSFFESLWERPASGLTEEVKAAVLSWAGFALRAVGRLGEASQPMKAGLKMYIKQKNWKYSAITAINLNELLLTLGEVKEAEKYAKQSVKVADQSGHGFSMNTGRTRLADVYHQVGRIKNAEELFIEAEDMQKKREPQYPYLYSLSGFLYSNLLISLGRYPEVLERTKETIKWVRNLLSIALDNLSLGRALMLQSIQDKSKDFSEVERFLDQAVDGLRKSGYQYYLPLGLFTRAVLYRQQKKFLQSWEDLDEAREIAEYGKMRLHLVDYFLEVCRNIKSQLAASSSQSPENNYQIIKDGKKLSLPKEEMEAKFKEYLEKAEKLIEETGYHRRDGKLKELRN